MRAQPLFIRPSRAKSRDVPTVERPSTSLGTAGGWGRVLFLIGLAFAQPAFADSLMPPAPLSYTQLPDPRQEAAAKALMETLRCLVCQGQSIADSDAELAADMRAMVRERIARGETPDEIRAWLVRRYGNWVSFSPPVEPATWLLWAAPVLLIVAGAVIARGSLRRRKR